MNWSAIPPQVYASFGVGVLAAAVAIGVAIYNKGRKRLTWRPVSVTFLVQGPGVSDERVEVRFSGEVVENPALVRVRITNDGGGAISAEDFKEPLTVLFPVSRVLTAEIDDSTPPNHRPEVKIDHDRVVVENALFNRSDQITLKCVVSLRHDALPGEVPFEDQIRVEARIKDANLRRRGSIAGALEIQLLRVTRRHTYASSVVFALIVGAYAKHVQLKPSLATMPKHAVWQALAYGLALSWIIITVYVMMPVMVTYLIDGIRDRLHRDKK